MQIPSVMADAYAWAAAWGGPIAGAAAAAVAGGAMATYAVGIASASYGGAGSTPSGASTPALSPSPEVMGEGGGGTGGTGRQTKDITVEGLDPDSDYVLSGEKLANMLIQAQRDGIGVTP